MHNRLLPGIIYQSCNNSNKPLFGVIGHKKPDSLICGKTQYLSGNFETADIIVVYFLIRLPLIMPVIVKVQY